MNVHPVTGKAILISGHDLKDLPRLLDVDQCNDAYSAIMLAIRLADSAFSWCEKYLYRTNSTCILDR
ncbi:hypothetical protein VY86_14755 [Photorhabdus thracensis]|uniref:Uncharacterized protein n=1 Tax=Photorhabdus thracensis TaxID=230089 RepID=A0A0F7LRB0_9GAMM|nr:hypothetical protein VY86_14755 [Photorhabdus thracensis]